MPTNKEKMDAYREKGMLSMGKLYELYCKIPVIGVPLARLLNRIMGVIIFLTTAPSRKRQDSIGPVKDYLLKIGKESNFPFEVIEESIGPDSFEFYVGYCPYGFKEPHQQKACDAAMDMDRTLFSMLGADLTVLEDAPHGAAKCRCLLKMKK